MSKGFKIYNLYSFLFFFYFHLIWITVYSQSIDELKNIKFDHISVKQGLSYNEIFSIVKDKQGYIWIATGEGLNRYDGINFKVYKHDERDSNSLINDRVVKIVLDKTGILWLATDGGLCSYNSLQDNFKKVRTAQTSENYIQGDLYVDREGTIWFGNQMGLNEINPITQKIIVYDLPENRNDRITSMFEDSKGSFWLTTLKTFLKFDRKDKKFQKNILPKELGSKMELNCICEDDSNNIWLGTWGEGLVRFDNNSMKYIIYKYNFTNRSASTKNIVLSIYEQKDSKDKFLWIGTADSGLSIFNLNTRKFSFFKIDLANERALNSYNVNNIYEDNGIIWFSTGDGIFKYDKYSQKFKTWEIEPLKNTGTIISSIQQDRNESQIFWISTWGSGFFKYDKSRDNYTSYTSKGFNNSLSNNYVNQMIQDRNGLIWLCTNDGLNKFDPKDNSYKVYRHIQGDSGSISVNTVFNIINSKSGKYWVSTPNGFAELNQNGKFINYNIISDENNKNCDKNIFSIFEDKSGILWLGSQSGGLYKFDPEKQNFKIYNYKNQYTSATTYSIMEDSAGILWLCSYVGFWKFDPVNEKFKRYYTQNGLPTDVIYGICEDSNNNLWLTTRNGLSKFDPGNERFTNYDNNDGLTVNVMEGSFDKCRDGNMYLGIRDKIDYFNPMNMTRNNISPPVVITSFKILDKEHEINDEIELSYGEKAFSFEFAVLNYSNTGKNQYAFMLEGFDKNWNDGNRRYASYTNLDPGEYYFRVKGSNNDGVWNDKGVSVKIIIKPPFWKTLWFIISMGFIFIVILGSFYNYRIIQLKKSKQIQENFSRKLIENQENERRRIASGLHDSLGQNLLVINNDIKQLIKKQKEPNNDLEEISAMIFDSINEVRHISAALHPHQLDKLGFKKAVEAMINRVSSSSGIEIEHDIDNVDNSLNKNQQINIYRIIQECLNNIIKHSNANKVEILIKTDFKTVNLTIVDNGKGFNPNIISESGFGLSGIKERVRLLGGNFKIESNEGKGTSIHLNMNFG